MAFPPYEKLVVASFRCKHLSFVILLSSLLLLLLLLFYYYDGSIEVGSVKDIIVIVTTKRNQRVPTILHSVRSWLYDDNK